MANLSDAAVQELLDKPNHAVISTLNDDGTISSSVIWVSVEGDTLAVNSAQGRRWPTNLSRDGKVTVLVYDPANPYEYLEVRGRASEAADGAEAHIDALAKKYIGQDTYPWREPGQVRVKFNITPDVVRHVKA